MRIPPASLASLPAEFVSHSYAHYNLEPFKGRDVAVIGGGSSATDLAALLNEAGAKVQLVARQPLVFHNKSMGKSRTLWEQVRHPRSGLGPGLKSRFFANSPEMFHTRLPERCPFARRENALGPPAAGHQRQGRRAPAGADWIYAGTRGDQRRPGKPAPSRRRRQATRDFDRTRDRRNRLQGGCRTLEVS